MWLVGGEPSEQDIIQLMNHCYRTRKSYDHCPLVQSAYLLFKGLGVLSTKPLSEPCNMLDCYDSISCFELFRSFRSPSKLGSRLHRLSADLREASRSGLQRHIYWRPRRLSIGHC